MFIIYIAKVAANYGLPATRPVYEKALEVLPNRQAAQMCLRFAALERKMGEIDRARAIYAHASQFCDPRVDPKFWTEWHDFEIDTGSEDTFREMLRIKRSVQAQFNTETSFLVAQAMTTRQGSNIVHVEPSDAMSAVEKNADSSTRPGFVASRIQAVANSNEDQEDTENSDNKVIVQNTDEIRISDEDV